MPRWPVVIVALLQGCSGPVLRAEHVAGWPLIADEASITCENGQAVRAVINGRTFALTGAEMAKHGLPSLNQGEPRLFRPHPDPFLAARGIKAYLDGFRAAAEKACRG